MPKIIDLKTILLFGAGKSATVLIDYLLKESIEQNWTLIVADTDQQLIESKTLFHKNAETAVTDITDTLARQQLIQRADIVISMMPPALHILVAKDCVDFGKDLLTASYADDAIKCLHQEALEKGIVLLCEMGLDPGIDHMSAMKILDQIIADGGEVISFKSHCGGLVAPESDDNPWKYKISWNPRNVVLAGKAGATYKDNGLVVQENYEDLFDGRKLVDTGIEEIGMLGFYPNRNSLPYLELYHLHNCPTFIRTTLRYTDFMYGWKNIVDLKLTDETAFYQTDGMSLQQFFQEHLKAHDFSDWLEKKLADSFTQTKSLLENLTHLMEAEQKAEIKGEPVPDNFMLVDEAGELKNIELEEIKKNAAATMALQVHEANLTLKQLFFLGMDDNETLINKGFCSAADVLQFCLETKLLLHPQDKDMVLMLHEISYRKDAKQHHISSSLMVKGEDSLHTAMAKTVGLPLGIAAKMILTGRIHLSGLHIPTIKEIYEPVLEELEKCGIRFTEKHTG
ncbi:MAG: saccharopine dehydrogenase [Ferruginibacter sp.]|nr:saccharopine dehydrogenase [Ferruginibacter sp.]